MSSFGSPWGWDDLGDEDQYWDENPYGDTLSIWRPYDPLPQFTPTISERAAYRDALGIMASRLSTEHLGAPSEDNPDTAPWAYATGPSGFGAAYSPAKLGWTKWGAHEPRARVGLSIWGQDHMAEPFPVLGGAIVTPTIDIFTRERAQRFDDYGLSLIHI